MCAMQQDAVRALVAIVSPSIFRVDHTQKNDHSINYGNEMNLIDFDIYNVFRMLFIRNKKIIFFLLSVKMPHLFTCIKSIKYASYE